MTEREGDAGGRTGCLPVDSTAGLLIWGFSYTFWDLNVFAFYCAEPEVVFVCRAFVSVSTVSRYTFFCQVQDICHSASEASCLFTLIIVNVIQPKCVRMFIYLSE